MFWTKARTVRRSVVAAVLVSGLAFPSFALADGRGAGRGHRAEAREASRERPAPQAGARARERDAERTPPSAREVAPRAETRRDRAVRPEPVVRSQPLERRTSPVPYGRQVRPTPVSEPRDSGPVGRETERVWQRDGRQRTDATPYRLYAGPEERRTPEPPRRAYRPEPRATPDRGQGAKPERSPVTAGRPRIQPWAPTSEQGRVGRERPQVDRDRQRERDRTRDRRDSPEPTGSPVPRARDRALNVPEARFRGPEAERETRVVRREDRERLQRQLRERLRDQNRRGDRPERQLPSHDTVGNVISPDAALIVRDGLSRISIGYGRVRRDFGPPRHHYLIAPRSHHDFWDGYWDGYVDGYWAGRHYWHGRRVVVTFYYGYYWSDPYWFAFYYPGYYPAIYHYWGWCPGWVYPSRVYYVPTEYVYVPATPYRYYYTGYSVDDTAAYRAMEDVRSAWFEGEISKLAYHLTDQVDIRVYFDGKYEYTTSTEDYYAMTVDAMATTHTVALDFDRPIWLSSHEFFVTGRHVFYDPNDDRQTVYVSYRFRNLGGEWFLVAVGSSLEPIRHQYHDFRYS